MDLQVFINFVKDYGYISIFSTILLNSFPGIGLLIPEEAIMAMGGYFAKQGDINVWVVLSMGFIGQIVGQTLLFYSSKRYKDTFLRIMHITSDRQHKIEKVMNKNKFNTHVIMKVNSTTRAIITILFSTRGMKFTRFILMEVPVSVVRSVTYTIIGYSFASSQAQLNSILSDLGIVVLITVAISLIVSYFTSKHIWDEA